MKSRFPLFLLLATVLLLLAVLPWGVQPPAAQAATVTFAYTSFEEPATGLQYVDTLSAAVDHALLNNPGEAPVNYTSIGGELGFASEYFNTRNDVGLTDGDFVGVTSFTGTVGSYPDGSQGFEIQDADGKMRTSLDTVTLTGKSTPTLSLDYFVQATGWESNDVLRIWVEVDGGTELDLLNTAGADIDNLGIEGAWNTLQLDLSGYTVATLRFELDSNSSSESLYVDNVLFVEDAAPAGPTSSSFEEPALGSGQYVDTGNAAVDHPLANNAGEPLVNYTSVGGELGFTSEYFNTRNDVGLTDGDFVGVTSFTGVVGSFPDGTQGFQISDPDGKMRTTMDTVTLTSFTMPAVSVQYFVQSTGWESNDGLRIWVEVDGGVELDLQNTFGSDIDTLGIEGSWLTVQLDLSGYTTATLRFELDANASSEAVYVDDIRFFDDVVPVQFVAIPTIQGSGTSSAFDGQVVQTSGIVVADFQAATELSGFFLQDPAGDGDAATSDGIFVATATPDVAAGDTVTVTGQVAERFELTVLQNVTDLTTGGSSALPAPAPLPLPEATNGDLEAYEGMLVRVDTPMTVAQNFFLGRYGQMTLSAGGRLFQPTQIHPPTSPARAALADDNARKLLILDDGQDVDSCGDNPNPVPYLGAPPPALIRAGDTVTNLVGVLDYGQINSGLDGPCFLPATTFARDYRLHPTQAPVFSNDNLRTAVPDSVGGSLQVASFNVLNYFNGDGMGGGFPTSRGADTLSEFNRQRDKIIAAIIAMDADIVGLMELENDYDDGALSAIADLVNGLNAAAGAGTYAYVDPGSAKIGTDEIAVGLIYQTGSVALVGSYSILDNSFDPAYDDSRNRPALAQTFRETASGETLTIVVNHLKSKGSACGPGDDDPVQGNCNVTRTTAAGVEVAWLATDPTGSGDPDFLVLGDLNAYAQEDPIQAFAGGGYADLAAQFIGNNAYSFIFDGLSGTLDYALANGSLLPQVTGVTEWHINTDEPAVISYDEDFNPPGYYASDVYRASDHDPVIIGLDLAPAETAVPSCLLTGYTDGPPALVTLTAQDNESGLAAVNGVITTNGVISTTFTPGTTNPVAVLLGKVDANLAATFELEVVDVTGNTQTCRVDWPAVINNQLGVSYATSFNGGTRTFTIDATWQNLGQDTVAGPAIEIKVLEGPGCPCIVSDQLGNSGGVGAIFPAALTNDLSDGLLAPGESFNHRLDVQLTNVAPFTFFVDVLGIKFTP